MLHRMRMIQFTLQQPLPEVQTTPQEWNSDPEVSIKNGDLFTRAWECDYDKSTFDAYHDNTALPEPPQIAVLTGLPPEEMWNTPGTPQKRSPEFFPSTEALCDRTDTYHYTDMMRKWAWNSINLILSTPAVQNTIYVTIASLIITTITDFQCLTQHQWWPNLSQYSLRNTYVRALGMPRSVLRKWYGVLCCD